MARILTIEDAHAGAHDQRAQRHRRTHSRPACRRLHAKPFAPDEMAARIEVLRALGGGLQSPAEVAAR
ncbi:MAG: hypothetical protein WB646_07235 [Steroidobacteraceae bacterium]